jgi:hypothetical protein
LHHLPGAARGQKRGTAGASVGVKKKKL